MVIVAIPLASAQEQVNSVQKIDGFPVVLDNETLFVIQANSGSFSPEERAQTITNRIENIAKDSSIDLAALKVEKQGNTTSIVLNKNILITLTENDAKAARETPQDLANEYQNKIKNAIEQYRESRQPRSLLFGILYTFLATITLIVTLLVLNKTFLKVYTQLDTWRETRIPAFRIQALELIPANQITDI
ncbi:MAG: hypothetical protein HC820_04375 [Hydrococcus sp. RM1_1_31]|nr:hypothetical protein [Hydrococcus sp. RM1_1_31]